MEACDSRSQSKIVEYSCVPAIYLDAPVEVGEMLRFRTDPRIGLWYWLVAAVLLLGFLASRLGV